MADDQGWGDMAFNGQSTLHTPNFDDMASETLRFDRFYAAAPVCSPTRGSVLTGRHPNRFGCAETSGDYAGRGIEDRRICDRPFREMARWLG